MTQVTKVTLTRRENESIQIGDFEMTVNKLCCNKQRAEVCFKMPNGTKKDFTFDRANSSYRLEQNIYVHFRNVRGNQSVYRFQAPRDIRILRSELLKEPSTKARIGLLVEQGDYRGVTSLLRTRPAHSVRVLLGRSGFVVEGKTTPDLLESVHSQLNYACSVKRLPKSAE